jgi:predicted ester cyclase
VRGFINDVANGGDLDAIDPYWAPDMIWRGGSLGEHHGIKAYMAFMKASGAGALTAMHLEVKNIVADADTVIALFTNSGTHTGAFMGTPATGKHAVWNGTGFYRVVGGKIAEATFVEDILALLFQLGITTLPRVADGK